MNTATRQGLFPQPYFARLVRASTLHSLRDRIEQIDAITDELSRLGFCRPMSDDSRSGEWAVLRQLAAGMPA